MKEENQKVSTFSQTLLWFGAAISIAEIIVVALLAPLGLIQGIWAIVLRHIIGGAILFPAGLIGEFVDCFLLHKTEININHSCNISNIILWFIGFIGYRLLMPYNFIMG